MPNDPWTSKPVRRGTCMYGYPAACGKPADIYEPMTYKTPGSSQWCAAHAKLGVTTKMGYRQSIETFSEEGRAAMQSCPGWTDKPPIAVY